MCRTETTGVKQPLQTQCDLKGNCGQELRSSGLLFIMFHQKKRKFKINYHRQTSLPSLTVTFKQRAWPCLTMKFTTPKKREEKGKQKNNEGGQEEEGEWESSKLTTRSWNSTVCPWSLKTKKKMLALSPRGLLKKQPRQIGPSFLSSPCCSFSPRHSLPLPRSFTGNYLSWLHQGSIINSHLGGPGAG